MWFGQRSLIVKVTLFNESRREVGKTHGPKVGSVLGLCEEQRELVCLEQGEGQWSVGR